MTSMFQEGMAFLESSMNEDMAEAVSISNGRFTTTGIKATLGRTRKELSDANNGATVLSNVCDAMISKSAYKLNGVEVEPQPDHVLTREGGSKYKPTPMMPNEPVWRWMSEVKKNVYRIHLIEVAN